MKIYTKTGDAGESSLYGGKRILKSDLRLEAYGSIDELNSALGLCLAVETGGAHRAAIVALQNKLFLVGSELASADKPPTGMKLIDEADVAELEQVMDGWQAKLPELKNFILPGGSPLAAQLHLARTVARRAERAVVRLNTATSVRPVLLQFLNRLSDYLFVMARQVNFEQGQAETIWHS